MKDAAMIGLTLFAATLAASLVAAAILCVVAIRPAELEGVAVLPFGTPDLANDTMVDGRSEATLAGDWQEIELNRLSDVQDFLDSLEACNVQHREMAVLDNDRFVVRWR
jgi:hypothetical protein